jgi:formate dehydrogenase major subunit
LGTSFGRGGATTFPRDLGNSDCILIQGSNMAECHPVAFQWVVEARQRGAKVIHVDPRFTRTSALADLHVPIRAGSDIVFLGALINHVIANERYFKEYVVRYTNAPVLIDEGFADTEDLDGLFSGFDPELGTYDDATWRYAGMADTEHAEGEHESETGQQFGGLGSPAGTEEAPESDETLQHPRCVFQILRRHFSRYTPELVEQACGVPAEQFLQVAELLCENSGRERTTSFAYAVGWTQHSVGAQYIRAAAILQLLLGNIGRPGGGIMALRGHAAIQGSSDIPTLYNLLPGYIPMANAEGFPDLATYLEKQTKKGGFWGHMDAYLISLLKAWWGEAATAGNDYCYDYLPRISGDHSTYRTTLDMADGKVRGFFLLGENPAVGSSNSRLQRLALAKLDWLVVRDLVEIESASFWYDAPEIESGELATADIATEVFFLPAASHVEKEGSFTNTQRLLQWREKALDPKDDCRSDLWFMYHLGLAVRRRLAGSTDPKDRPVLDLTWDYPTEGEHDDPSAEAVLREINGWGPDGRALSALTELKADGSTACGCWIYCGCYAGEVNQVARRRPAGEQSWVAPEWGWAWPANRRILYNRASGDPQGRPG